ncbi:MAG: hypothetical protein II227_03800 [Clostridia bacterium]|nr:hypothetical protein [Clostridia bacterium]
MLESAMDALGGEIDSSPEENKCGFCRWWNWPGETCMNGDSPYYAGYVRAFDAACGCYSPARGCLTCRHYLEGGQCAISLEQECRDGKARVYAPGEVRRWNKEVTVTCKSPEVYL